MELSVLTHFTYDRQEADKNKIMPTEVSLLLLHGFSAVIFFLFFFGWGQQIDDGVTEWHCILGSQDCGYKSKAIQLYNGLLSSHQRVGACYCITLVSSSKVVTVMLEGGGVRKLRPGMVMNYENLIKWKRRGGRVNISHDLQLVRCCDSFQKDLSNPSLRCIRKQIKLMNK